MDEAEPSDVPIPNALDDVPEGEGHFDLDLVLRDWSTLAAIAFNGALVSGRGVVVINVANSGTQVDYVAGPPCACHEHYTRNYDPEQQAVIVVRRAGMETVYLVGGVPSPAEAFKAAGASTFHKWVH